MKNMQNFPKFSFSNFLIKFEFKVEEKIKLNFYYLGLKIRRIIVNHATTNEAIPG